MDYWRILFTDLMICCQNGRLGEFNNRIQTSYLEIENSESVFSSKTSRKDFRRNPFTLEHGGSCSVMEVTHQLYAETKLNQEDPAKFRGPP